MLRAERVRAEFYDIRRRGIKTICGVGLRTAGGGIHPLPHSVGGKFSHGYLGERIEVGGFRGEGDRVDNLSSALRHTHSHTHNNKYSDNFSDIAT